MCGIVAIRSRESPVLRERIVSATNAILHRGPDGEGHWIAPDGRVGLGHRRLSVIDIETGAQPISNEDGTVIVVANGEFYGFDKIRCELEARGHRFRTSSDTEILVHLYEDLGTACLDKLRGEFAFVLWDQRTDTLFAARDRFGIKPLFYSEHGGELFFASEVKALFAAGFPAAWSDESVFRALFLCIGQDASLFEGVRQLPPGHFIVAKGASVRLHKYWDADYPMSDDGAHHVRDPVASISQVRNLIDEAVHLRMRADVPVGCLLSGGLDSSAVLGFASRHSNRPMRAFTIAFDDAAFDESALARETAAFTGAEFEPVHAGAAQLADNFVDSVAQGEIIQYNAHGTARYLLSRAIQRSGYKVVLGGEGADELFAGYGFCSSAVLSRASHRSMRGKLQLLLRLMRVATPSERAIRDTSPWLVRMSRVLNLSAGVIDPLSDRIGALQSILSNRFDTQPDPYRAMFDALNPGTQLRGREPAKQLIYLWMKSVFPAYVLAADRADMGHGVEVRLPFLDHVLFEYVKTIPVSLLALGGRRKHVLREAAGPYISAGVRERPKKPLMAPPFTGTQCNRLDDCIHDILHSPVMKEVSFFDTAALQSLVDNRRAARKASVDPLLLMAASVCVLQQRYGLS